MHAVVTGATNGIGEALARRLASEGLGVTIIGRNDERLHAARDRIMKAVPDAGLRLERADFAELSQVRDLAGRLLAGPRPDAVISCAAMVTSLDRKTSDGLPRVLAVNHLAPYLLLRTLAGNLDRARFVVVAADPVSLAQKPVDLDDLTFAHPEALGEPEGLRPFFAYGRTKNMNVMFAYALARRMVLAGKGITVNGVHPGVIAGTGLGNEAPEVGAILGQEYAAGRLPMPGPQPSGKGKPVPFDPMNFRDPANSPGPDIGADTPAWLATSPEAEGVTGKFFLDRTPVETAPHTTDIARCDRLWEESARLTGLPV